LCEGRYPECHAGYTHCQDLNSAIGSISYEAHA
jgi:hypothetical protein